jgi:hypothetical protein
MWHFAISIDSRKVEILGCKQSFGGLVHGWLVEDNQILVETQV